jgi:hypothetical protein
MHCGQTVARFRFETLAAVIIDIEAPNTINRPNVRWLQLAEFPAPHSRVHSNHRYPKLVSIAGEGCDHSSDIIKVVCLLLLGGSRRLMVIINPSAGFLEA